MTLETLNDLKIGNYCGECGREFEVSLEPVKDLAIKWLKEFIYTRNPDDGQIDFWMDKFNLIMEELK